MADARARPVRSVRALSAQLASSDVGRAETPARDRASARRRARAPGRRPAFAEAPAARGAAGHQSQLVRGIQPEADDADGAHTYDIRDRVRAHVLRIAAQARPGQRVLRPRRRHPGIPRVFQPGAGEHAQGVPARRRRAGGRG